MALAIPTMHMADWLHNNLKWDYILIEKIVIRRILIDFDFPQEILRVSKIGFLGSGGARRNIA